MPRRRRAEDDSGEHEKPRKPKSNKTLFVILGVVAGVVVLCGGGVTVAVIVLFGAMNKAVNDIEAKRTYPAKTADELIAEWAENPAAAAKRYEVTGVSVTGIVKAIGSNVHGQTYVDLVGTEKRDDVFAKTVHVFVLDPKAKDGLVACKVGQAVTVTAMPNDSVTPYPSLVATSVGPAK